MTDFQIYTMTILFPNLSFVFKVSGVICFLISVVPILSYLANFYEDFNKYEIMAMRKITMYFLIASSVFFILYSVIPSQSQSYDFIYSKYFINNGYIKNVPKHVMEYLSNGNK